MRDAAVGHQCVECVRQGNSTVRQARTAFGARTAPGATVTLTLIAINIVAYLFETSGAFVRQFEMLGEAVRGPGNELYVAHGSGALPPGYHWAGVAHGEWYRLLTGSFLHLPLSSGGFAITHILFNMWALWVVGPQLEQVLGRWRFLALYLLSAVGGNVLQYMVDPGKPAVGASGAIFGLFGAYFVIAKRTNADLRGIVTILGINLFITLVGGGAGLVSWEGHVGGLITGGALTVVYAYAPALKRTVWAVSGVTAVAVVLAALTVYKTGQIA
jgi:membrane associated rhomboid family serine protease